MIEILAGNPDAFKTVMKIEEKKEGWRRKVSAMDITDVGVLIQLTVVRDGEETNTLEFVPGARLIDNAGIWEFEKIPDAV